MRKIVGIVVVLTAGLACSACGSLLFDGVPSSSGSTYSVTTVIGVGHPVPVVYQLPIRRSGVGSESLGTFAMHGWLYVKATCVGAGRFEFEFAATSSKDSMSSNPRCLNSRRTVKFSSNFGVSDHRTRISIRAPAGMRWSIIVFEGPPDIGPHHLNVW